jgi:hypothetical protein
MRWFKAFGGLAIGLAGIALVAWKGGWIASLGVFLAIWGNNINQDRG